MTAQDHFSGPGSRSGRFLLLFLTLLLLFMGAILGVASYFHLGGDARALRESVFATLKARPDRTIDLNIGRFTVTAVQAGASLFSIPPEAKAVLSSLNGVEAGRYVLNNSEVPAAQDLLESSDNAMAARGWSRMVTVQKEPTLVVVYVSDTAAARDKLDCCLLVIHERDLIIASARADLKPLVNLAFEKAGDWTPPDAGKRLAALSHH